MRLLGKFYRGSELLFEVPVARIGPYQTIEVLPPSIPISKFSEEEMMMQPATVEVTYQPFEVVEISDDVSWIYFREVSCR
jgi:hypothetical protein